MPPGMAGHVQRVTRVGSARAEQKLIDVSTDDLVADERMQRHSFGTPHQGQPRKPDGPTYTVLIG